MELPELVRIAIRKKIKTKLRDFVGKDEYRVGDISNTLDGQIKDEVASLRDKPEYEPGDLTGALDTLAKWEASRLFGKE
jgi:hypothetical protein